MQSNTGKQDSYIGVKENEFKTRYNKHISSFKLEHRLSSTTLSEHIWNLKKSKMDHTIEWEILDKAYPIRHPLEDANSALRKESCTKDRYSTSDVSCSAHAPTEENASYKTRNCPMKTEMERERNTRRTLKTETRQHLKIAELARNRFVVKLSKEI